MRTHKFSTPQQQDTVGARIYTTTKWEVKKGFSTSYNPKVSKFDLYCVIDQEQQSTGQFRAALSRGLEHALVKTISQPQPPTAEETKTRLPAVTSLLEPRIPQKECSRRNGTRIKGPTPTPSPSPQSQPRRR